MDWTMEEGQDRTYVRMVGECDLYHAPKFKNEILKKIEDGARRIVFDLGGVSYLDSTGVGAIICILQTLKRCKGEARFQGISGGPRRVLEMSNILPLLQLDGQPSPTLATRNAAR